MRVALSIVALCLACVLLAGSCGRGSVYRYKSSYDASVPDASLLLLDGSIPDAAVPDAGPKPCIPGTIQLVRASPVATFIIDRSASMADDFGSGFPQPTKWSALSAALAKALPPIDQSVQVGALIFPLKGQVFACTPPGGADLSPALGNVGPLISLVDSNGPSGSTPTAGAIDIAAASVLGVRAATASRALVLATDGEPDCNGSLDPATCQCIGPGGCNSIRCLDDARTISRIAHYADAGLPTYIIGISNGDQTDVAFVSVLNNMAIAGGKPQQNASTEFYSVGDETELQAALTSISGQVGACVFLSSSVPLTDKGIVVNLNGEDVPETTGWFWTDRNNGELTFVGKFCDEVAANPTELPEVTITCDPSPQ